MSLWNAAVLLGLIGLGAACAERADDPCEGSHPPANCAPVPSCDEDPQTTGCPCASSAEPAVCHEGPEGTAGVGVCTVGVRHCSSDGVWSECVGQGLPHDEVCDHRDNDCDGDVDDGVLGACGDCNQDCSEIAWGDGAGDMSFDPSVSNSIGLGSRDSGALALLPDEMVLRVLWVSNSPEGTVSLIDTETRSERARYRTGPDSMRDDPSRTSVSFEGHAFVGNRARYGLGPGEGGVVKILEHDCPDVDGDGVVETSNGGSDVLDWGRDECVAWRTVLPEAVRAVAAQVKLEDGAIHEVVWAGTTEDGRFYELDGESGEQTGLETVLPDCPGVYGAALDRDGIMWVSCFFSGGFSRFDTFAPERTAHFASANPYGITVAPDGRVWSSDGHVFDPFDESTREVRGAVGSGIAADVSGSIWFGECGEGTCRVDAETLAVTTYPMASRGIAVDFDGFIWGVPNLAGTLTVMDPSTETFDTVLDDCADGPCLVAPYTYSDMTGTQLRNVMNPLGTWEAVLEGCSGEDQTHWLRMSWDADVPADTSLRIQVRAADGLASLSLRPWADLAIVPSDVSPIALDEVLGMASDSAFLGLRVVFSTIARGDTPVLHRIAVQRSCGEIFR